MTDSPTALPYAVDLTNIAELLGELRGSQAGEVCAALAEDRVGVLALAERVARMRGLNAPAAVFVSRIRAGDYHEAPTPPPSATGKPDPAEVMRRLYFAKLDMLDRMRWRTPVMREREALDYAVSYLPSCAHGPMPDGGILQLEAELCAELGIDRHAGSR